MESTRVLRKRSISNKSLQKNKRMYDSTKHLKTEQCSENGDVLDTMPVLEMETSFSASESYEEVNGRNSIPDLRMSPEQINEILFGFASDRDSDDNAYRKNKVHTGTLSGSNNCKQNDMSELDGSKSHDDKCSRASTSNDVESEPKCSFYNRNSSKRVPKQIGRCNEDTSVDVQSPVIMNGNHSNTDLDFRSQAIMRKLRRSVTPSTNLEFAHSIASQMSDDQNKNLIMRITTIPTLPPQMNKSLIQVRKDYVDKVVQPLPVNIVKAPPIPVTPDPPDIDKTESPKSNSEDNQTAIFNYLQLCRPSLMKRNRDKKDSINKTLKSLRIRPKQLHEIPKMQRRKKLLPKAMEQNTPSFQEILKEKNDVIVTNGVNSKCTRSNLHDACNNIDEQYMKNHNIDSDLNKIAIQNNNVGADHKQTPKLKQLFYPTTQDMISFKDVTIYAKPTKKYMRLQLKDINVTGKINSPTKEWTNSFETMNGSTCNRLSNTASSLSILPAVNMLTYQNLFAKKHSCDRHLIKSTNSSCTQCSRNNTDDLLVNSSTKHRSTSIILLDSDTEEVEIICDDQLPINIEEPLGNNKKLPINTEKSVIREKSQINMEKPVIREKSQINMEKPVIREKSQINMEKPVIREKSQINTEKPVIREKSQINTEKPVIREKSQINTEKPVIREKSQINTEKPVIREKSQINTEKPVIREKLQINTEKPVIREKLQINTEKPFIRENAQINPEKPIIREISQINTEKPVIREKCSINTEKPVIREKSQINIEKPVIREKLSINAEKSVIREKSSINAEKSVIRENSPINTVKSVIREKSPINTEKSVIREKSPINTEKSVLREKSPIITEKSVIREKSPLNRAKLKSPVISCDVIDLTLNVASDTEESNVEDVTCSKRQINLVTPRDKLIEDSPERRLGLLRLHVFESLKAYNCMTQVDDTRKRERLMQNETGKIRQFAHKPAKLYRSKSYPLIRSASDDITFDNIKCPIYRFHKNEVSNPSLMSYIEQQERCNELSLSENSLENLSDEVSDPVVNILHRMNIMVVLRDKFVSFYQRQSPGFCFTSMRLWQLRGRLPRTLLNGGTKVNHHSNCVWATWQETAYIELWTRKDDSLTYLQAVVYHIKMKQKPQVSLIKLEPLSSTSHVVFTILSSSPILVLGHNDRDNKRFSLQLYKLDTVGTVSPLVVDLPSVGYFCADLHVTNDTYIVGYGRGRVAVWNLQDDSLMMEALWHEMTAVWYEQTNAIAKITRCLWAELVEDTLYLLVYLNYLDAKSLQLLCVGTPPNQSLQLLHKYLLPQIFTQICSASVSVPDCRVVATFTSGTCCYTFPTLPYVLGETHVRYFRPGTIFPNGDNVVIHENGQAFLTKVASTV